MTDSARAAKGPGTSLQNLHPRFKSGRRLQPSLALANAGASFGWQATRKVVHRSAEREGGRRHLIAKLDPIEYPASSYRRGLSEMCETPRSGFEIVREFQGLGSAVALHSRGEMPFSKRFVYVLKNGGEPPRYYTGLTSDVGARLLSHNEGHCRHTASGRPWHVDVIVEFADEPRAAAFERYLKSGSGTAFAKRHLR